MLKSSKRITFTTEAVNTFGFRVLTSGISTEQFNLNPLMLWMHQRPLGLRKDEILPLGNVCDLQLAGSNYSGQQYFDDTDPFAVSIYNKYENGTLRMCSAGLVPVEWSEDPALKLPGQTLPTLVKSVLQEVTCCDIGANPEALAVALYDLNGHKINLSAGNANSVISSLKLSATSANISLQDVHSNHTAATLAIIDNAIKIKKLTADEAAVMLGAGTDEASVEKIKQFIRNRPIDTEKLKSQLHPALLKDAGKSWQDLKRGYAGDLQNLRDYAPDVYRAKVFEGTGQLPMEYEGKPLYK